MGVINLMGGANRHVGGAQTDKHAKSLSQSIDNIG